VALSVAALMASPTLMAAPWLTPTMASHSACVGEGAKVIFMQPCLFCIDDPK
jgi:hypothetical protein